MNAVRRRISYKWILIGAGVTFALNFAMRALLADPIRTDLITSVSSPTTGLYVYAGTIAFVSFYVGGIMIGFWNPGYTIKEPAIASALAIVLNTRNSSE